MYFESFFKLKKEKRLKPSSTYLHFKLNALEFDYCLFSLVLLLAFTKELTRFLSGKEVGDKAVEEGRKLGNGEVLLLSFFAI